MKKNRYIFLLFTCTLFLSACTSCSEKVSTCGALCADSSIYYNDDSLMVYARRAYIDDDPAALFITGTAAYLHAADSAARDSLSVVPLDEADIMLLRACELNYEPAFIVVHYLDQLGLWSHSVPDHDYTTFCVDTASFGADYFSLEVKK